MPGKKVHFRSSYEDLDEVPMLDDSVEETEIRGNVENYPDSSMRDLPVDIFSMQKINAFYGDLEGLNSPHAKFQSRHLPFVNINSSVLSYGNFEMANMVCASISSSKLQGSNFRYVDLEYSEITKSDLSSADLSHCNLRGSKIKDSDFRWADLRGADLGDCTVQSSKFQNAIYDEYTMLPFDKTQAKRMGMVFVSTKLNAG